MDAVETAISWVGRKAWIGAQHVVDEVDASLQQNTDAFTIIDVWAGLIPARIDTFGNAVDDVIQHL